MIYLSGAFIIIGILTVLYVASVVAAIGFVHGLKLAFRKSDVLTVEIDRDPQDGGAK